MAIVLNPLILTEPTGSKTTISEGVNLYSSGIYDFNSNNKIDYTSELVDFQGYRGQCSFINDVYKTLIFRGNIIRCGLLKIWTYSEGLSVEIEWKNGTNVFNGKCNGAGTLFIQYPLTPFMSVMEVPQVGQTVYICRNTYFIIIPIQKWMQKFIIKEREWAKV